MQTEMQTETTPSKPKQRTVQEVFNVVLDAGLYGADKPCQFMCNALSYAMGNYGHAPIITRAEYTRAKRSIKRYLRVLADRRGLYSDSLVSALGLYAAGSDWQQHLPILEGAYRNWAKRPRRPLAGRGSAGYTEDSV